MSVEPSLQPGVQSIVDDPESGESVTLLVDYEGTSEATVLDRLRDAGAEVEKSLVRNTVAVSVDESDVAAVCDLSPVTYVEVEGQLKPQSGPRSSESDFR